MSSTDSHQQLGMRARAASYRDRYLPPDLTVHLRPHVITHRGLDYVVISGDDNAVRAVYRVQNDGIPRRLRRLPLGLLAAFERGEV